MQQLGQMLFARARWFEGSVEAKLVLDKACTGGDAVACNNAAALARRLAKRRLPAKNPDALP
jgi:hypothetical protein